MKVWRRGERTTHQTLGTLAIAFGEPEDAKSLTTANKRETSEPMLQFDTIIPPAKSSRYEQVLQLSSTGCIVQRYESLSLRSGCWY
jgi:hypothetical protein